MPLPRFLARLIRRLLRTAPEETHRSEDPCRSIWKDYSDSLRALQDHLTSSPRSNCYNSNLASDSVRQVYQFTETSCSPAYDLVHLSRNLKNGLIDSQWRFLLRSNLQKTSTHASNMVICGNPAVSSIPETIDACSPAYDFVELSITEKIIPLTLNRVPLQRQLLKTSPTQMTS